MTVHYDFPETKIINTIPYQKIISLKKDDNLLKIGDATVIWDITKTDEFNESYIKANSKIPHTQNLLSNNDVVLPINDTEVLESIRSDTKINLFSLDNYTDHDYEFSAVDLEDDLHDALTSQIKI